VLQHRPRRHQVEVGPLGVLLEARGGVEDVSDEDDLPPEVAELAGGDGAAVEAAPEGGQRLEVALVPVPAPRDGLAVRKKQRTQLAPRRPAGIGQVMTTSSPAYW